MSTQTVLNKFGTTTIHDRIVKLTSMQPMVIMEMRFSETVYDDGGVFRGNSLMFICPELKTSLYIQPSGYGALIKALGNVVSEGHQKFKDNQIPNRFSNTVGEVTVSVTQRGVGVAYKGQANMMVYRSPHAKVTSEFGGLSSQKLLSRHIQCADDILTALIPTVAAGDAWITKRALPENNDHGEIVQPHMLYRQVPSSEAGRGLTTMSILVHKCLNFTESVYRVQLSTSNTILSLYDESSDHNPRPKWVLIQLRKALITLKHLMEDNPDVPQRVDLFDCTAQYDMFKVYNGYVASVPSKRGMRIVINYDYVPAYSKLSWLDSEIDMDDVLAAFDHIIEHYPADN